jgi:hypothetical protein
MYWFDSRVIKCGRLTVFQVIWPQATLLTPSAPRHKGEPFINEPECSQSPSSDEFFSAATQEQIRESSSDELGEMSLRKLKSSDKLFNRLRQIKKNLSDDWPQKKKPRQIVEIRRG